MLVKSFLSIGLLALSLLTVSCSQEPQRVVSKIKKPSGENSNAEKNEDGVKKNPEQDKESTEPTNEKPVDSDSMKETDTPSETKDPENPAIVDQPPSTHLDASYITKFLDEIAGPKNAGRGTGAAENEAVAQKIADEFKALGLKATGDNGTYFQAFSASGKPTQNIIGVLPGETDEYIVIGGHMDHLGVKSGQIYPGADDNASGTTGVMASAHAFLKNTGKLKRGIIFIAFSGEEMGLLGSIYYVKNPTVPLKKIKYMINLDMIGRYSQELEISGLERTIEGNSLGRELMGKTSLKTKYLSDAQDEGGSDHVSFRKVGIPTVSFFSGYHADYHKPGDTLEKLDKNDLKIITGVAADLAYGLAKAEALTSANFALIPIEVEGYSKGVHSPSGCAPGLVTFEELQTNLSQLDGLRVD